MKITVAYALADRQLLLQLEMAEGATIADAIGQSGLDREFPEIMLTKTPVGIHGLVTGRETPLCDGDRVEIYRPLLAEAKDARRARLKARPR